MRASSILVAAVALSSCAQPQLRGGATAAQLEQIKPVIRAATWARITVVTRQSDGTFLVDVANGSGYHLQRVKGRWEIDREKVHIEAD